MKGGTSELYAAYGGADALFIIICALNDGTLHPDIYALLEPSRLLALRKTTGKPRPIAERSCACCCCRCSESCFFFFGRTLEFRPFRCDSWSIQSCGRCSATLVAVHRYDRVHFGPEHGVNTPCSFVFTPETAETLCLCSLCVHFGTEHKCNTMCSFTLPLCSPFALGICFANFF